MICVINPVSGLCKRAWDELVSLRYLTLFSYSWGVLKKQASKQTPFKIIIHGAMGTTRCHSSVHCTAHVQARRSRSWDGKWSTINHRPRTKVWPARLRSACSWRSEAERKSVWCTIHRNAVPENNKQQLKMWSSKCHSPPQHSNLILSSAAPPFPLWTGTVRSLWWSPRSVCFCSRVRRQSLTRMCSEINVVPSSEEPFEARRIWTVPPHRSCSQADSHGGHIQAPHLSPAKTRDVFGHIWKTVRGVLPGDQACSSLPFCTVMSHWFQHYDHFCHPSTRVKQKTIATTPRRWETEQRPKPEYTKGP